MKYLVGSIVLIGVIFCGFWFWKSDRPDVSAQETPDQVVLLDVPSGPRIEIQSREVIEDDTFTKVMEDLGVSYADALEIVSSAEEVFDFTSIKLGKTFRLVKEDGLPVRIEYEPGTEYAVVVDLQNGFETHKEPIAYDVSVETAEVTINSSLFEDGVAAGLSEQLIIEFANVFAWEIDFATQVQAGDTMKVLYEKRFRGGEEAGIGNVLAGTFTNYGETVEGYRFEDAEGEVGYYNAEGDSLVRPFLKAPLSYSRITSGFTYSRFHPVLGTNTMHRAIDYAAPLGTPIMAVGDGTILQAGWNGGYGNYVAIRHNDRLRTNYGHLSAFAKGIKPGARVTQGQVIGYVGSTGWSTGPHVHYEVQEYGTLVNPLEVEFPKGDALPEEELEDFFHHRDMLKAQGGL